MMNFNQVMHDWRRMCNTLDKTHGEEACSYCPIFHTDTIVGCCDAIYEDLAANIDWDKVATIVEAWAAEHPEPVYPTWLDYLHTVGLIKTENCTTYGFDFTKAREPIPADIAEKLGLKPKEGENNV